MILLFWIKYFFLGVKWMIKIPPLKGGYKKKFKNTSILVYCHFTPINTIELNYYNSFNFYRFKMSSYIAILYP